MLTLTKLSETASKITLGWQPVPGAIGYRFQSSTQAPKWSHTWDETKSQVTFSKAAWYKVEALGVEDAGEYPAAPPTGNPYTDVDFSSGRYFGQGVYVVFEAYQSDPRLADWGGQDAVNYDSYGMSTDQAQRVHLHPLFGRPWVSWQELRNSDGPWASNAPNLAKSTLNVTQQATWNGQFRMGDERWFAWDVLFPLNVNGVSFEFCNGWHSLMDLHPASSSTGGTTEVYIRPESGNLRNLTFGTSPNPNTTGYTEATLLELRSSSGVRNAGVYNVWHEYVLGIKASDQGTIGNSPGWVEVWFNGANVFPRQSRPSVLPGENGLYAQMQNYRQYTTPWLGADRGALAYGGFRAGMTRADVQTR